MNNVCWNYTLHLACAHTLPCKSRDKIVSKYCNFPQRSAKTRLRSKTKKVSYSKHVRQKRVSRYSKQNVLLLITPVVTNLLTYLLTWWTIILTNVVCGRVPDLQSGGCGFESRPGMLRTKVYSAFHTSGVGKWVGPTSCGWEGKGRYGSFRLRIKRGVCR